MRRRDMNRQPIEFFNRYTGRLEKEAIYGEGFLRWAYETGPGRLTVAAMVKRTLFSRWYGWRMSQPSTRRLIGRFIEDFGVDTEEFADRPDAFKHFNAFFVRRLKPEARPIDEAAASAVFPADGRHLVVPDLAAMDQFYVKGQRFNVQAFLDDAALAARFAHGTLVLSRLCPTDYHRFHFPISGTAGATRLIKGALYSVSPIALRRRLAYLWENKRTVTEIDSPEFGHVVVAEIGATCVGSIVQTWKGEGAVRKGDEKGYFAFGGSSVITLFEPGRIAPGTDLAHWSAKGIEIYARMGDSMGTATG